MPKVLADYDTGEVLEVLDEGEEYYKLNQGDMVVKNNSLVYLKGTVDFVNKFNFVKLNVAAIKDLSNLSRYMSLLFDKIAFETGILTHANGRIITPKSLAGMLKRSSRTGNLVIKELIDAEVLKKHTNGRTSYFTFNPWIAVKGKRITRDLYEDFYQSKWADVVKKKDTSKWGEWND